MESETGSGKTLAFLLPALSLLDYPPALYPEDLPGPQLVVLVPTRELGVQAVMLVYKLFGGSVNPGVPGERANMFRYRGPRGLRVKGLLLPSEVELAVAGRYLLGAHVVVGTPELIQEAMVSGGVAGCTGSACPPAAASPLSRVSSHAEGEEAAQLQRRFRSLTSLMCAARWLSHSAGCGWVLQGRGVEVVQHCRVIAMDEADACFSQHPQETAAILDAALSGEGGNYAPSAAHPGGASSSSEPLPEGGPPGTRSAPGAGSAPRQRPVVVLVGATVDEALVERAVGAGWMQDPVRVAVGDRMRVPRGLRHRYIVCGEAERVGAMCRQLRADLRAQSLDAAPARVMVFAASEAQARALSDPLRTVLWGEHKISVLLPEGTEPITALHSFRDNKTTLLLATPAAARGLDLPAVTHVYNVTPPASAADYLHRAGRAGRIGSTVPGTVTTLVAEGELAGWMGVAAELGLELERIEAPAPVGTGGAEGDVDVEDVRRALEDILALSPSEPQQPDGDDVWGG